MGVHAYDHFMKMKEEMYADMKSDDEWLSGRKQRKRKRESENIAEFKICYMYIAEVKSREQVVMTAFIFVLSTRRSREYLCSVQIIDMLYLLLMVGEQIFISISHGNRHNKNKKVNWPSALSAGWLHRKQTKLIDSAPSKL